MSKSNPRAASASLHQLTESAILIALGTALSLIPIWKMPLGGSVTPLSMLPVCLIGLRHGMPWSIGAAFVYSVLQMLLGIAEVIGWGLTPLVLIACLLLDYLLPFTLLGITGIARGSGRGGMCASIFAAMVLRFVCHLLSGVVLFAEWAPEGWNPLVYSVCYNGAYMLPECIFTMAAVLILSSLPRTRAILMGDSVK